MSKDTITRLIDAFEQLALIKHTCKKEGIELNVKSISLSDNHAKFIKPYLANRTDIDSFLTGLEIKWINKDDSPIQFMFEIKNSPQ